jgi:Flp pilus assembly protein TadG
VIRTRVRRRGATVVEVAAVAPVLLLLIFGFIVMGLGVFRYIQVASLAREGARHAAVRGADYAKETNQPAATADSILKEVVLPRAAGFDPSRMSCAVTWDQSNAPRRMNADKTTTMNTVSVTVTYVWRPEIAYFAGVTLTSKSTVPMSH